MLFMANLLPNRFHEKAMHVTKSRLDLQAVKKIPLQMVSGQQMKEEEHAQNY